MIKADDLTKTYWFFEKEAGLSGSLRDLFSSRKVFVEAVKSIHLDIKPGELVGFIGPNGAGKTTTLKMLSGILHPSSGELSVAGFVPSRRETAFLRAITFVTGQRNRLFWDLPAEEYFQFCRVVYEIPDEDFRKNRQELVEMAGIGDILKVPQRKLSAGERKRCELVAAFLHDPQVIFLDEPTNALDLVNARRIREFIRNKGKAGGHTIILTSHNMADIEDVCERVIIINRGQIAFDGMIGHLYSMKGLKKQIRVLFGGPYNMSELSLLGEVRHANSHEVLIEIEAGHATAVASRLLSSMPVLDIGISDLPLEKIVEAIYLE